MVVRRAVTSAKLHSEGFDFNIFLPRVRISNESYRTSNILAHVEKHIEQ